MSELKNISTEISWVDRVNKRFHDIGQVIPTKQRKLYEKIRDHWTSGRTVIDIGCSLGVGSNILSHTARHVWGIDINEESINWAKQVYDRPNLSFELLDIEHPPSREVSKFGVVVAIEIIEHLADLDTGLQTIKKFFSDKHQTVGFITIPNINNDDVKERDQNNHLHNYHWTAGDFYGLMIQHFKSVTLYSVDKLETWSHEETVDGNTKDPLVVAVVEGAI